MSDKGKLEVTWEDWADLVARRFCVTRQAALRALKALDADNPAGAFSKLAAMGFEHALGYIINGG